MKMLDPEKEDWKQYTEKEGTWLDGITEAMNVKLS